MNPAQQAVALGQGIWHDNIRRGLITSGELQHLIQLGLTGLTSNPTIFEKAIAGSSDYDALLLAQARAGHSPLETYEVLAVSDIQAACDLLRPVYDRTGGGDGYASIEVSAASPDDTDAMLEEARRLWRAVSRPNALIKIPATDAGIPAVRQLLSEGISVNITLIFSLDVHKQVMAAFLDGLEDLARNGGDLNKIASVASFFLSRVDTAVDARLDAQINAGRNDLRPLLGKAAVANAKLAYQNFKQMVLESPRFAALAQRGARVQRPLWASTGTKDPAYPDLHYVEPLFGPDTVNTMPPQTITALLDHGRVQPTLEEGVEASRQVLAQVAAAGIDMDEVTETLRMEGVKAFAESFDKLLDNIQEKQAELSSERLASAALGPVERVVEAALERLDEKNANRRIWQRDHTLWGPDPAEIADRLGWLTVTDQMCELAPALEGFAREVKEAGFRDVVLLGMGGSSLGPEVLRRVFGSREGFPRLIVLDSTLPERVTEVTRRIDPAHTLFLVSSKSGTTIEPLSLYKHFRTLVENRLGAEGAGQHFVAITDPGTPLQGMAREQGFRRSFLNPPPIGGRYSVLSCFGLVPAVLLGVDILKMLDRADRMREGCAPYVPSADNPGAWLGAVLGGLARHGRDKLTLIASPAIAPFGLWAEQLLAESTGKGGKGIVPVTGEPLVAPSSYDPDRIFVYLRLQDSDGLDSAVQGLKAAGHPVIQFDLRDTYDLGGEFFRWEYATAVAGALLEINPFDQPDVQAAKDQTDRILREYLEAGASPAPEGGSPGAAGRRSGTPGEPGRVPGGPAAEDMDPAAGAALKALLAGAQQGDYLAIMAYLPESDEIDEAIAGLRREVVQRYRIATTAGYGPRFLHSTGQLHKGGPADALCLQLVAQHPIDVEIPGESYTFGVLADAQALGDLDALKARDRRVVHVRLGVDYHSGLRRLIETLG